MIVETLTQLQYSNDREGPWRLYIFYVAEGPGATAFHSGGQWFSKTITYPDEEITVNTAFLRAMAALKEGREVRVVDGGDKLVFHAKDRKVLYAGSSGEFWQEIICT